MTPETEAERRRAFRALLRNPLLQATGETAEEFTLVRRHSEWLKNWLSKFPAWSLHLDKDVARLRKIPADLLDETRPAIDRTTGTTFTRRRYAMLCFALAALERMDRQTTLGQVAQAIIQFIASDRNLQSAGLVFDVGNHDQRRDLVHAVRLLMDLGVLSKLDGDERQFQTRNDSADVLYDINRAVLAAILNVSRSASSVEAMPGAVGGSLTERAAKLTEESRSGTDEAPSHRIRSRLVRALLDDPILYFEDLSEEERIYFGEHRGYLLRQICEATGLVAEVRREGVALVDDDDFLTDVKLPEQGMDGHVSLLLVQWFAECAKPGVKAAIPLLAVEEHVQTLIQIHGGEWRKEVREAGAESRLTQDALTRLRALRLIRLTADGVVPLAAAARYAAERKDKYAVADRSYS